ncbi:DUF177 domain-containing protein [Clostridium botulinum]|uniref:DUF177 domain-containing protein n=1 Tax=Clostridium botulinum (strain Eklund 17B / Type B) TaxID=935198 RepID=B2TJ18_CLOBB|nr:MULTISPECIES: DUF177 domain-containing protein [Clostridium]ACD23256.1 conserved hypothetical protein [Clostridium botulinum B str. Eklund 17B (NRP)]AIY80340.1 hypothetical protein U728_3678 [Clostridium botulinum 202F]KAI3348587.1 DUF177 domain-containing protein [Clostridium botulinum]SJT75000.1 Uncharacterized ACR, COG1399 [Clostridioides difficile]KFX58269.1 metal-binding protein [Clostridium botulinum]
MKVRVSDLISRKERSKKIDYKFEIPKFEFEGDVITPVSKCEVSGVITSDKDIVIMKAKVKVTLEMNCARCLDTFIYPIDIDIEERFANNNNLQEEEVVIVLDDILDISQIIESNIISTLPIQRLCKNDCKGLCQECGSNLNKQPCSCNKYDTDIRFDVLKGLFDNKEV